MDEQNILEILQEKSPNGKISCEEARKLAREIGVELSKIGELCDQAAIKICACALGCF
jgi:hypothetical protein